MTDRAVFLNEADQEISFEEVVLTPEQLDMIGGGQAVVNSV